MLASIDHLISAKNLTKIRQLLDDSPFVDGKLSAGMVAKAVKNNQEMNPQSSHYQELNELVMSNLVRHPKYKAVAWPKRVAAPFYARYEPGMEYGEHVDDPVMGQRNDLYRTDISTTIFLSEPDEYEGGELVITTSMDAPIPGMSLAISGEEPPPAPPTKPASAPAPEATPNASAMGSAMTAAVTPPKMSPRRLPR